MIKFDVKNVGVDAGAILICDENFYKQYNYKFDESLSYKKELENGMYRCHWCIDNTWNGNVYGDGYLKVETGVIIISDPCYCIKQENSNDYDSWGRILDITDCLQHEPNGTVLLNSMGGDGEYNVKITLYKIEGVK